MMSICDIRATATQYALLTSVMAIGNTLIGVLSGWMLKNLDYQSFYALSIVAAAPGLMLIPFLRRNEISKTIAL
jgi:PAT family beta-lactamase induction signal transducer AmpG